MPDKITLSRLKEIFEYDRDTGIFTYKIQTDPRAKVGQPAGTLNDKGYIKIGIDGKRYLAHRLAWLFVYGRLPDNQLDHVNHNRSDNRISNLREVTNKENGLNQSKRIDNTSGCVGVHFKKSISRWVAYIKFDGKIIHIGCFGTKEDAIIARKDKEIELGYHNNHGKLLEID